MRIFRHLRVLSAALLLAACNDATEPVLGGDYLGMVDSPFGVEGSALLEITHPDIRSVSAPGRVLVVRGVSERTLRLLVINPPRLQNGGPLQFIVRMADGAVPPTGVVLAVAAPANEPRGFTGEYAVRFTRLEEGYQPVPGGPPTSGPPAAVPFARLVAPFFPAGPLLYPEEQVVVDRAGNGNAYFDLGDVRGYLRTHPGEIPPESTWTR
jgi:hypothetical protein